MIKVGLMIGRIMNLTPTYFFISETNHPGYFMLLGAASLLLIPLCIASRKTKSVGYE
ncbi:hypothetical protein MUO83_06840 [Candidatus Bathyarchaeota archaeon]|jgi:hypothetical protein|nr:hypothetical protein [Candidatus Bathyarchaeota archaeon]